MTDTKTLDQKVVTALNSLIAIFWADYFFYRAASQWCDMNGFKCASDYFVDYYHCKASKNGAHGIEKHMSTWGVLPEMPEIKGGMAEFGDLPDIVDQAYTHESDLYDAINAAIAEVGDDYPALEIFLERYVKSQDNNVRRYRTMLQRLDGVTDKATLILLSKSIF